MARIVTIQFTEQFNITGGPQSGKAYLLRGVYNGVTFEIIVNKIELSKYEYDPNFDKRYQLSDDYLNHNTKTIHEEMSGSCGWELPPNRLAALGFSNLDAFLNALDGRSHNPYFDKNKRTWEFRFKD